MGDADINPLSTLYVFILTFYISHGELPGGLAALGVGACPSPAPVAGDPGEIAAATPKGQWLPCSDLIFGGRSLCARSERPRGEVRAWRGASPFSLAANPEEVARLRG